MDAPCSEAHLVLDKQLQSVGARAGWARSLEQPRAATPRGQEPQELAGTPSQATPRPARATKSTSFEVAKLGGDYKNVL